MAKERPGTEGVTNDFKGLIADYVIQGCAVNKTWSPRNSEKL